MNIYKPVILALLFCFLGIQLQAQDHEYNLDETYSISENGTIYLDSDDAEVNITGSDRSDVHVQVYHRVDKEGLSLGTLGEFEMNVETRNGDLYLREDDNMGHIIIAGSVTEEYRITLEVPRSVALDLEGDDDSYEISDVDADVRLDADDAEIDLRGAKGNSFEFDIDDGSIQMDQGQGILKLSLDDGEFRARQGKFSEIDAEADDGEIELTTVLPSRGSYLFDMDDGDLTINLAGGGGEFDISHDDSNINASGNFEKVSQDEDRSVYRLPGGNARIEINTGDGDINLQTI